MTDLSTTPADGATAPDAEVETPEVETEVEGVDLDTEETEEAEEGEKAQAKAEPEPDDTEEVEHDGKKYKLPKPLKGALLMQADYTRKTQSLAEERRQHEASVKAFQEQQKLEGEVIADKARVVAINDAVAQYEKVDWARLRAENPKAYDEHWFNYQQTVIAKDKAEKALNQKIGEASSKANAAAQADAQTRFDKFRTDALAQVPEIAAPEYLGKLNAYAVSLGFTPKELAEVRDVRVLKALNAAYNGSLAQAAEAKARVTKAVEAKAKVAQTAKPLSTVKGTAGTRVSPSDPASDKLSAEEWVRRRNEQTRKQGRR